MRYSSFLFSILFSLISSLTWAHSIYGEDEPQISLADSLKKWKIKGVVAIAFAQTSFSHWVAGGQNSLTYNSLFLGSANYRYKKTIWDNTLELGYGVMRQASDSYFTKNNDKIDISTKIGHKVFKNGYLAGLFNLKTQMVNGYSYPDVDKRVSGFFAPAFLIVAPGIDYKPSGYFNLFYSPATTKTTFVLDHTLAAEGSFGVPPGEETAFGIGSYMRIGYSRGDYKNASLKNVSINTRIDLYSDYKKDPKNVGINWEVLIAMKVNKFLSLTFLANLVYDDNIKTPSDIDGDGAVEPGEFAGPEIQFKEIFGFGLSYNFDTK